jgi:Spy/CpxP family protein refolding chaperone
MEQTIISDMATHGTAGMTDQRRVVPLPLSDTVVQCTLRTYSVCTVDNTLHRRVSVLLTWIKLPTAPARPSARGRMIRNREIVMIKKTAIAATALVIAASPLAYAAETSSTVGMQHLSAADLNALTDVRVNTIKAALQLTPDQEKYWPAVEDAIRTGSKNRQARLERRAQLRESTTGTAQERNPIELMQRRADSLAQRSADLKKLADAWEPLYKTLSPDQKKRMAFVSSVALRGIRDMVEQRIESEEEDD